MTTNAPDPRDASAAAAPSDADAAVTAIIAEWGDPAGERPAPTPPVPPLPPTPSLPPSGDVSVTSPAARPTVRWGALVWALLFGATAAATLWIIIEPARRDAVGEWLATLSPLAAALYAIVAVGVIVALFGIVGLIRRGERTRR